MVLNLMKQMAARVHRLLKFIALDACDIWRRRYELSKQLQDLHTDVALFSEGHLTHREGFFIPKSLLSDRPLPGKKILTTLCLRLQYS
jgi:hypothetical protein